MWFGNDAKGWRLSSVGAVPAGRPRSTSVLDMLQHRQMRLMKTQVGLVPDESPELPAPGVRGDSPLTDVTSDIASPPPSVPASLRAALKRSASAEDTPDIRLGGRPRRASKGLEAICADSGWTSESGRAHRRRGARKEPRRSRSLSQHGDGQ